MKIKNKINFGWENEEEKIRRRLKITPKNKLIWLKEFNDFIYSCLSEKQKKLRSDRHFSR